MCYSREKRIRYLGDKGGLKTQVHHEPQEGIHDVPEQVRILLTLGLGKQNKVISDLVMVTCSPWRWSQISHTP